MKKLLLAVLCLTFIFSVVACADAEKGSSDPQITVQENRVVKTPDSASEFEGNNYELVVSEFKNAGFTNIKTKPIEDLGSADYLIDGNVESIVVDEDDDFAEGAEFPANAKVVIAYHTIKKVALPVSSDEVQDIESAELESLLREKGFINIDSKEVYDLDPDSTDVAYKTEISIADRSSFARHEEIPFDAKITIVVHRPYEKYTVKMHIDFIPNFLFNKYNVDLYVDGIEEDRIAHGTDADYEFRFKKGTHVFTFKEELRTPDRAKMILDVNCDIDVTYQLACYDDVIEVKETFIDRKRELAENEARVPVAAFDYKYKNYEEVIKELKAAGFTNITTEILYDIVLGWTSEGEVKSVSIDGKSDFNRGAIFEKGAPVVVTYHMLAEDDPTRIELPAGTDDYIGMNYLEVEKALRDIGLTNIAFETFKTSVSPDREGTVRSVEIDLWDFDKGDKVYPDDEVVIEYYIYEAPPPKEEASSPVFYSTNDRETAKQGNSGVFSYKSRGGSYDVYWIIDFNAGYVYYFTEGNGESSCDRVKIVSGDLNDYIKVTWHDGGEEWSWKLHFKYKNHPETLVVNDHLGLSNEFSTTDLSSALSIRNGKTIKDY